MATGETLNQEKFVFITDIDSIEKANPNTTVSDLDKLYYNDCKIIFYFKYFIIETYDRDLWYDLLDHREFRKLFYCTVNTYGDRILGPMLDFTMNYFNVTLVKMLTDFGSYVRSVESRPIEEFAPLE